MRALSLGRLGRGSAPPTTLAKLRSADMFIKDLSKRWVRDACVLPIHESFHRTRLYERIQGLVDTAGILRALVRFVFAPSADGNRWLSLLHPLIQRTRDL